MYYRIQKFINKFFFYTIYYIQIISFPIYFEHISFTLNIFDKKSKTRKNLKKGIDEILFMPL